MDGWMDGWMGERRGSDFGYLLFPTSFDSSRPMLGNSCTKALETLPP